MEITDRVIDRFRATIAGEEDLDLVFVEVQLSGFEARPNRAILTDIPDEETHAVQLDIYYRDGNASDVDAFDFDATKVETFIIPRKDGGNLNGVGYLFGLILHKDDAVAWYRHLNGYSSRFTPEEPSEP